VTVTAEGDSADIQVLPGVGSAAATFTGGALTGVLSGAPLIDVKVLPSTATSTYNGTSWSSTSHSSAATITINIPGDVQTIDLTAPGQCQEAGTGTPLDSTVCLSAAATAGGTASGGSATADSLRADLLTQLPGAPGHGVQLNLGDVAVSGTSPPPPATTASSSPPAPATPVALPVPSPTTVHTGAWWSGSMPFIVSGAAVGGVLIGWPRIRRLPFVARVIARGRG
jgi:hypothetical protein